MEGVKCNGDGEVEEFHWMCKNENGTGTLGFEFLPWSMKLFRVCSNALSADPMDGHLCVVGRISTQSLGKPGATRYYWDPPGWHRVSARAFVIHTAVEYRRQWRKQKNYHHRARACVP